MHPASQSVIAKLAMIIYVGWCKYFLATTFVHIRKFSAAVGKSVMVYTVPIVINCLLKLSVESKYTPKKEHFVLMFTAVVLLFVFGSYLLEHEFLDETFGLYLLENKFLGKTFCRLVD